MSGARPPVAAVLAVLACIVAGCGARASDKSPETNSTTLTVYASLPLQGAAAPVSEAVPSGERRALPEAGGRVGGLTVKLVVLDDATPATDGWDRIKTADNARTALRDKTAIAYLGE